ncbi:MAG: hypothetical protein RQ736_11205 [Thiogranum sp.]|nr:hypothetical protein [Thiogranum sp.]
MNKIPALNFSALLKIAALIMIMFAFTPGQVLAGYGYGYSHQDRHYGYRGGHQRGNYGHNYVYKNRYYGSHGRHHRYYNRGYYSGYRGSNGHSSSRRHGSLKRHR